jgi:SAM-dependent methyltransferase
MGSGDFPAGFFEREETERRSAARLDDAAVAAVRDLYSDLEIDGNVLDLCGVSAAHFEFPPDDLIRFAGHEHAPLPYEDATFDDVLCSGGVGGMTHPLETFAEVARVLKPGGHFVCTFASDFYARAAVRGWATTDDTGRVRIVRKYFELTPAFGGAESDLRTSLTGAGDRLWAVWALKKR